MKRGANTVAQTVSVPFGRSLRRFVTIVKLAIVALLDGFDVLEVGIDLLVLVKLTDLDCHCLLISYFLHLCVPRNTIIQL